MCRVSARRLSIYNFAWRLLNRVVELFEKDKNQVATLILIKINIIFYVEKENQINQLMLEVPPGLQSLLSESELYLFT
jgi:hypothetical protein